MVLCLTTFTSGRCVPYGYLTRWHVGSHTVIVNLYDFLRKENDRRLEKALDAPRLHNMCTNPQLAFETQGGNGPPGFYNC